MSEKQKKANRTIKNVTLPPFNLLILDINVGNLKKGTKGNENDAGLFKEIFHVSLQQQYGAHTVQKMNTYSCGKQQLQRKNTHLKL